MDKNDLTDLRIREIPITLKARLKSEAAIAGVTLNEYVVGILSARKAGGK